MATAIATYEVAGHVSRVVRFITDLLITMQRRRAARETREILSFLTDAQLEDIGIHRADISRRF
ncbi:DUF1127 domain-containing protein [uncultured Maritimibacter sp.]|uniref:DUF1127 domain-containing protein n=1 Tax=uncultured Maritimibacter sp. TaxID=991866 RepID=UPI0026349099|nr:DUF1127 domain-containing protein [uncultured Maritimibacter sp.]